MAELSTGFLLNSETVFVATMGYMELNRLMRLSFFMKSPAPKYFSLRNYQLDDACVVASLK